MRKIILCYDFHIEYSSPTPNEPFGVSVFANIQVQCISFCGCGCVGPSTVAHPPLNT